MVHIAIHDVQDFLSSDRLEDIDFTRIAAQKQAMRAFGQQFYLIWTFRSRFGSCSGIKTAAFSRADRPVLQGVRPGFSLYYQHGGQFGQAQPR
jgi:hypothetical protein